MWLAGLSYGPGNTLLLQKEQVGWKPINTTAAESLNIFFSPEILWKVKFHVRLKGKHMVLRKTSINQMKDLNLKNMTEYTSYDRLYGILGKAFGKLLEN